jgi:hypothetical protein
MLLIYLFNTHVTAKKILSQKHLEKYLRLLVAITTQMKNERKPLWSQKYYYYNLQMF